MPYAKNYPFHPRPDEKDLPSIPVDVPGDEEYLDVLFAPERDKESEETWFHNLKRKWMLDPYAQGLFDYDEKGRNPAGNTTKDTLYQGTGLDNLQLRKSGIEESMEEKNIGVFEERQYEIPGEYKLKENIEYGENIKRYIWRPMPGDFMYYPEVGNIARYEKWAERTPEGWGGLDGVCFITIVEGPDKGESDWINNLDAKRGIPIEKIASRKKEEENMKKKSVSNIGEGDVSMICPECGEEIPVSIMVETDEDTGESYSWLVPKEQECIVCGYIISDEDYQNYLDELDEEIYGSRKKLAQEYTTKTLYKLLDEHLLPGCIYNLRKERGTGGWRVQLYNEKLYDEMGITVPYLQFSLFPTFYDEEDIIEEFEANCEEALKMEKEGTRKLTEKDVVYRNYDVMEFIKAIKKEDNLELSSNDMTELYHYAHDDKWADELEAWEFAIIMGLWAEGKWHVDWEPAMISMDSKKSAHERTPFYTEEDYKELKSEAKQYDKLEDWLNQALMATWLDVEPLKEIWEKAHGKKDLGTIKTSAQYGELDDMASFLSQKKIEEIKTKAQELMYIDNEILDKMGLDDERHQKLVSAHFPLSDPGVNEIRDIYLNYVKEYVTEKVPAIIYLILEDNNYHTFNEALAYLGLFDPSIDDITFYHFEEWENVNASKKLAQESDKIYWRDIPEDGIIGIDKTTGEYLFDGQLIYWYGDEAEEAASFLEKRAKTYDENKKWVNTYEITRHYGGDEEGGWWYNHYDCVDSVQIDVSEAEKTRDEKYKEYEHLIEGDIYSMGGGTDILVYIEDVKAGKETVGRPHYESKKLAEEEYKTDEEIEEEFKDYEIKSLEFRDSSKDSGFIEIYFPEAGESVGGGTEYVVDNFIIYDTGKIAFDNWYPENIYLELVDYIRKNRKTSSKKLAQDFDTTEGRPTVEHKEPLETEEEIDIDEDFFEGEKPTGISHTPGQKPLTPSREKEVIEVEKDFLRRLTPMDMKEYTQLTNERTEAEAEGDLSKSDYMDHAIKNLLKKYQEAPSTINESSPASFVGRMMKAHTMLNEGDYTVVISAIQDRLTKLKNDMKLKVVSASVYRIDRESDNKAVVDFSLDMMSRQSLSSRNIVVRAFKEGDEIEILPYFWDSLGRQYHFDEAGIKKVFNFVDTTKHVLDEFKEKEENTR